MAAVYLVRHGQASFEGDDYDRLSALGHVQARAVGTALAARGLTPSAIVSGSLRRHRETAAGCLAAMSQSTDCPFDPDWNEYDHLEVLARIDPRFASQRGIADYVQRRSADQPPFREHFRAGMQRWMHGEHDADYREPFAAFAGRVEAALDRLVTGLPSGRTALVFTSGGVIAVIARRLLGLDLPATLRLTAGITNASITKLLVGRSGPKLSSFNEHGHFEAANAHLLSYR